MQENITITVENGFNAMIISGYQCRQFIEELKCEKIKILWDPANALYYGDIAYPDAYNEIRNYLGHVHIKDLNCSIIEGWVDIKNIGHGQMAQYLTIFGKRWNVMAMTAMSRLRISSVLKEVILRTVTIWILRNFRNDLPEFKKIGATLVIVYLKGIVKKILDNKGRRIV